MNLILIIIIYTYYPDNIVTTLGVYDLHAQEISARTIDFAQLFVFAQRMLTPIGTCNTVACQSYAISQILYYTVKHKIFI